ncbi:MAG: SGNH/GDSL hydrolase family protein, partial [Clostridia bacterium]|nr:SGNH/GDSL hydrolase family protein [Clostridia bacterium]
MKIEEIDRNLKVENALGRDDIVFMDAKSEPFRIYGLYDYKNQPRYIRLPAEVAEKTSPLVNELAYNTSGGRVRFATDSPFIAIRCKMPKITHDPGMALTGTSGFDLYVHRDDGHDTYHHTFVPPFDMKDGYESLQGGFDDGKMHTYTIHFPLYNDVDSLEIGLQAGAHLEAGAEYRPIAPIVYYGSSITQGGDVSRPGNSYQNIIAQRNNVDYINLGFSGACKAEDSMIEYL